MTPGPARDFTLDRFQEEAIAHIDADASVAVAYLFLCQVQRARGQLDEALAAADRAVALAPGDANAFGERAVLKLMYAALIRASETWRGVIVKPFETKQLRAIGEELDAEYRAVHELKPTKSTSASPSRKSSKNRT